MDAKEIQRLSNEELDKKYRGDRILVILLGVLSVLLAGFAIEEYLTAPETEWFTLIMAICTLGGLVSVWPEFRAVGKERERRKQGGA